MNSKLQKVLIFASGVATGAAGMFVFIKTKWQKSFEAKRNEMIQYYESRSTEDQPKKETKEEDLDEEPEYIEKEVEKSKEIIRNFNYSKISGTPEKTRNGPSVLNDGDYSSEPYEIRSVDFGTQEMYEMMTLYLYDDGEVRTERYELLDDEDIENYLGHILEKLADLRDENPELDAYYVRNDRLKTDYEILIEAGRYEET